MLQWMGGSRRKVTSSRNSQHKRQKQYFEQRKRQQQKTSELQTSAEGTNVYGHPQKEHRSLDILSLLNVKADDRAMPCPAVKRKENAEVNAPEMKDYSTERPPLINIVTPVGLGDHEKAGTPSQYHMETEYPNKILSRDPDCHINSSKGNNDKSDCFRTPTEQHFSVLDLVDDDGPNGMPEQVTGHEAHVAFAVEGLGKVGSETPVHSPQQSGRTFPYGCSSSLKGATKPNSLKNLDNVMDELELQVNGMVQDIDMALGVSSFDFPMNGVDPFNNLKQKLSTAKSSERYDCHGYKTKSSFYDSYNIASNNEDVWGASYGILDDKVPEEVGYDLSQKNWSYQMHGMSADPLKYREYDMLDYNFEGPLLKKRNAAEATDRFKISEPQSPYSNYQVAEDYHNCNASNMARPPSERWKFDFGEVTDEPYWTSQVKEDAGDSYSLLSEESCSSSAVRGEAYHDLQSYSRPRDNRRGHGGNALGSHANRNNVKNIYAREMQYDLEDIQQSHNVHRSGGLSGVTHPSKSKPWNYSACPLKEKVEPLNSWLFDEGFTSVDARSDFHSFSGTSDAKLRPSRSNHWTDNNLGAFVTPESHGKSSGESKHGVPAECPPSCSSFSRNFVFDQPFTDLDLQPLNSPGCIRPTNAYLSPDCEVDGTPLPGSSHISGSNAKTRKESSVRKQECTSKTQLFSCEKVELGEEFNTWNNSSCSENVRAVVASNSKGNDSECKEAQKVNTDIKKNVVTANSADQEEGTSSSVKISGQSEWSPNDKEYQQDARNPLPSQSPCKGMQDAGVIDEKMEGERGDTFDGSSSPQQVLMLKSYVLQLLCVQQILKEASSQHTLNKE